MIKVDKVDEGLPISVIIPLSAHRRKFFNQFVMPLLESNDPMEIVINDNLGSAPKKRNEGFKKSTQPYLFFCDDDILMPNDLLKNLYDLLQKNPDAAYAYTGYEGIVLHPKGHPMKGNFPIDSMKFNEDILKKMNYISTMALIRRDKFPMFDESLLRLQDWDLWLTMLKNGDKGVFLPNEKFYAYYLDEGQTSNNNSESMAIYNIRKKHNI